MILSAIRTFLCGKEKTEAVPEGVKQVGPKETIHLPLNIPQNIRDSINDYWRWKQDHTTSPKQKNKICQELFQACKRWHLYTSVEVVAGLILINTSVGVTVFSNYNYKTFPYCQATNGWDELDGRAEGLSEKLLKNGKCYKYRWA